MLNFKYGKKKPDERTLLFVGVVLSTLVAVLSKMLRTPQERLWDLLDEVQRKYFPQTIINDVLLKDPKIVERRISRDVDKAMEKYKSLTQDDDLGKITLSRFNEKAPDSSEAQRLLGGEISISSPWVDKTHDGEVK